MTSGAIVHAGDSALLLAPADALIVRTGFETEDLGVLRVGLEATVEPVLGSDDEGTVTGTLAELHRIVDPDTQLVEAVIHPASAPSWVLPGTTVRVGVVVRSAIEAVLVPRDALLARDGTRGVFVVDRGVAHWTTIEIGVEGHDVVEAKSGLAAGARVVTTGRSVLSDGMAVAETGSGPAS